MKSGNTLRLPFIKDWGIRVSNEEIISLRIERHWLATWLHTEKLVVESINLSQIEAITHTN